QYGKTFVPSPKRMEGIRWITKAANQGLPEAWFELGQNTFGEENLRAYMKAADLGHPKAFEVLLDILLFRATEKADITMAKKYSDKAKALKLDLPYATIDACDQAG